MSWDERRENLEDGKIDTWAWRYVLGHGGTFQCQGTD
jgi:hypothetical protein